MKAWFKQVFKHFNLRPKKQSLKPATYFCHVPKTAGTSFIVLLDRFFAVDKIYPHQLWREAKAIDVMSNEHYDLYRGHFGGGGVDVLSNRPLEYLTILRDPTNLAHSTYQFVKREQNTKVHDLVVNQNMGFAQFLAHPVTSPLVKNRMIRNISFDFIEDPAAQEVFLSAETIEYLQSIIKQQRAAITDEQRLERAKVFINKSRWFGLLERFDESLQLLCYEMFWPPMGETQKLNTFKKNHQLDHQEQRLIKSLNQQDYLLYQHALNEFDQRISAMHKQLKEYQTHGSQTTDKLIDLRYQQQQEKELNPDLPIGLDYGFQQKLFGSQWHRRELMQPENQYFRWTGPGTQASLDCWLQPMDYQLSIRIINATSIELLDQLKVAINGKKVNWSSSDSGLVRVLSIQCPAQLIKTNGLARITFECHEMISHAQAFASDDERLVGLAVHWVKFSHE